MERPVLNSDKVAELIATKYGLRVMQQTNLNSYDDVNVHVRVADDSENQHISHVADDGYVLKILNTVDSQKTEFVGAMHFAIDRVYQHNIITPRPVPTKGGQLFTMETLETSTQTGRFLVRLFEYIPGELLDGKAYTVKLCYQVGKIGGQIDAALKNFNHSGILNHTRHWNLRNVGTLDEMVDCIDDADDRALVNDVCQQFRNNVLAKGDKLQKGVIHADLNEGNILVRTKDNSPADDKYDVCGILDFGDLVMEYHVYEVAIAIAYTMIESKHGLDPLDAGGHVLAGYLSELKLPKIDCSILKECVAARLSQSITYGVYNHKMDPSNNYCLRTGTYGWPLLRQLWNLPKQDLYSKWGNIIKSYNIDVEFE